MQDEKIIELELLANNLKSMIDLSYQTNDASDEGLMDENNFSQEELIDHTIYSLGHLIRENFSSYPFYNYIFFLLATTPSIVLNLIKMIINLINGTLICPQFDSSGEMEMLHQVGRLKIVIFPNDHSPPHFHVKTEYLNLKLSIDTCEIIGKKTRNNLRSKEFKIIKEWHQHNKSRLEHVWNKYQSNR